MCFEDLHRELALLHSRPPHMYWEGPDVKGECEGIEIVVNDVSDDSVSLGVSWLSSRTC